MSTPNYAKIIILTKLEEGDRVIVGYDNTGNTISVGRFDEQEYHIYRNRKCVGGNALSTIMYYTPETAIEAALLMCEM